MERILQDIWELRAEESQEQENDNKVDMQKVSEVSELEGFIVKLFTT